MHSVNPAPAEARAQDVRLEETRVAMLLDADTCLLANGRQARRAASCLLELQTGDLVLASRGEGAACHVLHVLERGGAEAALSVPGCRSLALRQAKVSVHAVDSLALVSAGEARLMTLGGSLTLQAPNLFVTVAENLVQQTRHLLSRAGHCLLDVRHLFKLHAQDALLTAERDLKADAERISMG
ncbi:DUF3540 domain-containing protein [Pseudothauera nasutitermitis]|uniref:DUF3540 domain-containing protein n=1 Tax=Pseudothauera nasutitermitis TaxID=2565930 RepID=A0A4S4AV53_9RHOO|nr:DUF3540 domain-containing protein [Pseudothauera nasutitermitis]THF63704.1 DUF3540 domain-containing protein [Pseudothauera nasutitermitis]